MSLALHMKGGDRQQGLSQLSPRRRAQLQGSYDTIHHMLAQHLEGSKSRIQQQLYCVRTKCATPLCVWLMATIIMCWFLRWNKRYRERQRPAHAWFHQSDMLVEERVCFSGCGARHGCLLPNVTLYIVEQLEQQYPQEYAQRGTDPAIAKYNDLIKRYRAM
eukprot:17696-Heterococcus_DN1.PRE.1